MTKPQKNAIITGGSRGLGLALAHALGRQGYRTTLVARDSAALDTAVKELEAAGHTVHGVVADVGEPDAGSRIAGLAAAVHGPTTLLVNNASTLGPVPLRPLLDLDPDDLARVFSVNTFAAFHLTRAVAGNMVLAGGGTIVNISSDAAVEAYPTWGAYSASKAALDHLTRVWSTELAPAGVRMLSIDPGEMNTAMHAAALPEAKASDLRAPDDVARAITEILAADAPGDVRVRAMEAA